MKKLLDFLSIPIALWFATAIRFSSDSVSFRELYLLMAGLIAWYVSSFLFGLYQKCDTNFCISKRAPTVFLFFFLMTGLSFYAHNELNFSRIVLVIFTVFQFLFPPLFLTLIEKVFIGKSQQYGSLLIGNGVIFEETVAEYARKKRNFVPLKLENSEPSLVLSSLITAEAQQSIKEVVVLFDTLEKECNELVLPFCHDHGFRCQIITPTAIAGSYPLYATSIGSKTYFRPLSNRLEGKDSRILKRAFDVFGSLSIITMLSPLLLLVTAIIKLTSPKERVVFTQSRTGYNQNRFNCLKFRSMNTVSQEVADATQATKGDPRITKLGAFMRKTNIDELPQLFNVLKGDMSLIGPRPHPVIMDHLQEDVPQYLLRHFVIPGMTGWAQVNGWRGITDTNNKIEKRVEFDLWYVENWSIWLDIKILFMTIFSRESYKNAV